MKRYLIPVILSAMLLSASCKQKAPALLEPPKGFNNQLTQEEKDGGVMTPEIMWKFRRLGTFALSPDGTNIVYTVTDTDLGSEEKELRFSNRLSPEENLSN